MLALINQRRAAGATCGTTVYAPTGPLSMQSQLREAARAHSLDMGTNNYFSHTSLDGRSFFQRIVDSGWAGSCPCGENIAAGYSSPEAVVSGWMSSPGHCANIMSASYGAIGIGAAFKSGSTYGWYWTQDFAAR
ncbi:MAG: CAP domain-containing protein [Deltaproteobacteria bacterium]|nr:CAP domain-containing protein [Deltaproteobacteria bacterium]